MYRSISQYVLHILLKQIYINILIHYNPLIYAHIITYRHLLPSFFRSFKYDPDSAGASGRAVEPKAAPSPVKARTPAGSEGQT